MTQQPPRGTRVSSRPNNKREQLSSAHLEHVAYRLRRHLERADLVEVVLLDTADRAPRLLEDGRDLGELVLDLRGVVVVVAVVVVVVVVMVAPPAGRPRRTRRRRRAAPTPLWRS